MKIPYLNPEIHSRILDPAVNKDKGGGRGLRQIVKIIIPLIKTIISLK